MLAVLGQIKARKQVDTGTTYAVGKRIVAPTYLNHDLTLENLCMRVVSALLQSIDGRNYEKVASQCAQVPADVRLKILQFMTGRRELTGHALTAALQGVSFSVFITPRNQNLNDTWAKQFAPLCADLQVLDVRGCAGVSVASVIEIAKVCGEKLTYLDMSGREHNCIASDVVTLLHLTPNLKFLGIRQTNQEFSGLHNLAQLCPRLQQLEISYSHGYTLPMLESIVRGLPDLNWLDLGWCSGVYDDSVVMIARTLGEGLVALNVDTCCTGGLVTDEGVLEVAANCPNLERLSVSDLSLVTDVSIIAIVQKCPKLTSLHVSGCSLTDVGVTAIAEHCPNLELLSMAGLLYVTDKAALKLLEKCEQLQYVDLANCPGISEDTKLKFGPKRLWLHPDTNAAYIPFRESKKGVIM